VSPGEAYEALRARGEQELAVRAMVEQPEAVVRDAAIDSPAPAVRTPEAGA
jgi:hypothetical protein